MAKATKKKPATKKKSKPKKWKSPVWTVRMSIHRPGDEKPVGIEVEFKLEHKSSRPVSEVGIVTGMMNAIENIVRDNVKVEVKQDDGEWKPYRVCGDNF